MENAEEVLQCLDEFSKRRPKNIPRELEEYLSYVARTGDPVYQWPLIKFLFKEKLLNVLTEFYETSPGLDLPHCPNVDPFNYDSMKNSLMERIDAFTSAPFTVQRICELLTTPRKQYSRIDKFMRAVEKNILVVSTREPGPLRHTESDNGEPIDSIVNGSDSNSDYNVDVEMEDMSNWKDNTENIQTSPSQPSSSETNINVNIGPQFTNHSEPETSTETLKMHQITAEEEQRTALLEADNVEPSDQRDLSMNEAKCEVKSSESKCTEDADSNIDSDEPTSKPLPEESSTDDKNIEMESDLEEKEDIGAESKLQCDEVQSPIIPQITIEPVPAIDEETTTTTTETDSSEKIINIAIEKPPTVPPNEHIVEATTVVQPTEEKSLADVVISGDDSSSSNSSDNVDANSNASSTGSNDSGEKSPQDSNDGITTPQESYDEPTVAETNIMESSTEVTNKQEISKDDGVLGHGKIQAVTEDRLSHDSITDNLDEDKIRNNDSATESLTSNVSSEKTDEMKDNIKNVSSPDKPTEQVNEVAGTEVTEKFDSNVEAECKDT